MPFHETPYDDGTRRRNRIAIAVAVLAAWIACALGTALTDWPLANALGMAAVALVFGAALWFMFGARRAGRVGLTPASKQSLRRTFWQR